MKQIWLLLLLAYFPCYAQTKIPLSVRTKIYQHLAGTEIQAIKPTPIEGLYQITTPKNIFYSDATATYLMFGHLLHLPTQTDLTEQAQQQRNLNLNIAWTSLPIRSAIKLGKSQANKVAIFIDVDCPYCRQLYQLLKKQANLEIYVYLYPLTRIHPNALQKSQQIWCSADPAESLQQALTGIALTAPSNCNKQALNDIQRFANQHSFTGTPILIREDGAVKIGMPDEASLKAWLRYAPKETLVANRNKL